MKKGFFKKAIAAGMAVCILATSSITAAFAAAKTTEMQRVENPYMNSQNWMGFLPNKANMSDINLPGTHDSGTTEIMDVNISAVFAQAVAITAPIPVVGELVFGASLLAPTVGLVGSRSLNAFAKDQDRTIPEQLNDGVRLLDCRLSCYETQLNGPENLTLSHGGFKCVDKSGKDLKFDRVLNDVKSFLKEHPTETVVVQMQEEGLPKNFNDGSENEFLDALLQGLNAELKLLFHVDKITEIKKNARTVMLNFLDKCRNDSDFIVVDENTDYPTVGEARGKIILTTDEMITTKDKQPGHVSGDYEVKGKTKWENLTNPETGILNGKEQPLSYSKNTDTNTRICPRLAATSCASESAGQYFGDAIKLFIGNSSIVGEFAKLIGKPIEDPGAISPGHMHARVVNPKLKAYDWQKGKFYGWIYTDFEDEELSKKIYETNIFDFDIAGHPLKYVSDIKIAFEQNFKDAKSNLEKGGYTVLDHNFNEEGPDKGLSDAVVNGKKNNGSFNIAIGYKLTDDPGQAITGIKWTTKEKETDPMPENVSTMIKNGNYELVDLYSTQVESKSIKSSQGLADLNIGTAGKLVNLYTTKSSTVGERVTELTSVQDYNRSKIDIKTGEAINRRIIDKSKAAIKNSFANGMEAVRDINGYTFSSNLGRNNMNDVHIFYNTAYNTKTVSNAYFPIYTGEGAGQIRELKK